MARTIGRLPLDRVVKVGLVGGGIAVYVSVIGMVAKFDERDVFTDVISLGYLLLLLVPLIVGNLASRAREESEQSGPGAVVSAGAIAGLVSVALLVLLVLVQKGLEGAEIDIREIFLNISPQLIDTILLFGRGTGPGIAILFAAGAVIGGLGGALHLIPPDPRRLGLIGVVATILFSLTSSVLVPMFGNLKEKTNLLLFESDYLFEGEGLHVQGALIILVLSLVVAYLVSRRKARIAAGGRKTLPVRERIQRLPNQSRYPVLVVLGALCLIAILVLPDILGQFVITVLSLVGLYILLGLGLNIVVGYAGLLDLGYVAFFAIGAYSAAIFTSLDSFMVKEEGQVLAEAGYTNFWVALPIIVIIAVVLGAAIGGPVLRLRGDYLAIVTLGFGEIIRTLVLSDWLEGVLGGAQGIIRIPRPPPEAWTGEIENLIYIILAFVLIAMFISYRLSDSRVGRAWIAMREDESVAEAMGISVIKYKLLAFAIGAGIACLGGAFFAIQLGSIFPNSFGLLVSINVLAVIILGGMGSIPGVAVGALVLVGLPEILREFQEYRLLIFGAVLVAIMIVRPEGLIPSKRRQIELHEEEILEELARDEGAAAALATGVGAGTTVPEGDER